MLLKIKLFSKILNDNTFLNVIIPPIMNNKRMRVLWLLHGGDGDHNEWCYNSRIEDYVEEKNLLVVMPSLGNSFYADNINGYKYFTYLAQELPNILSDIFPISKLGEDNYIAGVSMGGYGAFKLALNYPNRYKMAAAISGSMDLKAIYDYALENDVTTAKHFNAVFCSIDDFQNSKNDLFHLIKMKQKENDLPKLYMCCGTNDFLYDVSKNYVKYLNSLDIHLTYEEDNGYYHDFKYWDLKIQRVLEWMNLD